MDSGGGPSKGLDFPLQNSGLRKGPFSQRTSIGGMIVRLLNSLLLMTMFVLQSWRFLGHSLNPCEEKVNDKSERIQEDTPHLWE